MKATLATYKKGWDSMDYDLIAGQFSDDAEFCVSMGESTCSIGKEVIRAQLKGYAAFNKGIHLVLPKVFQVQDSLQMEFIGAGYYGGTCVWATTGIIQQQYNQAGQITSHRQTVDVEASPMPECLLKIMAPPGEHIALAAAVSLDQMKATLATYKKGWDSMDYDLIAGQFSDDAEFCVSMGESACSTGKEVIRAQLKSYAVFNKGIHLVFLKASQVQDSLQMEFVGAGYYGGTCVWATTGIIQQKYNKAGEIISHRQTVDVGASPMPECLLKIMAPPSKNL
jgi:hypothetical protein